jgi:pimeloyl-ACP methyl ester carboxylesterase
MHPDRAAKIDLMTQELLERIDYEVCGSGPTVVLAPGSCSTGAAWRPLMEAWDNSLRCVTTSLLGYGGTTERRTAHDTSIAYEADALEWVIRRASGGRVHLVGHSFGGLVAIAVALRNRVRLASLVIIEAPAVELLRERGEQEHYRAFHRMSEAYFAAHGSGDAEAIAAMIDFYGGAGTFASWPPVFAPTPCKRPRSTFLTGVARMVSRCRQQRWPQSKPQPSCLGAEQVIRRCNASTGSSLSA